MFNVPVLRDAVWYMFFVLISCCVCVRVFGLCVCVVACDGLCVVARCVCIGYCCCCVVVCACLRLWFKCVCLCLVYCVMFIV